MSGALVSSLLMTGRVTATPPTGAGAARSEGFGSSLAVLSPCIIKFSHTYCSHSFALPNIMAHPPASPHPPLGLPGCRRHHRAHFQPSRWSIRVDHLRWTESRVRPVLLTESRLLSPLHLVFPIADVPEREVL